MRIVITGGSKAMLVCCAIAGTAGSTNVRAAANEKPTKPPNILFIFTDQQQADMMSACDPNRVSTPAMDSIARRGVRFTRAFCVTPQCSPSRAALLTGRWPHEVNMMGNLGYPSLPLEPSIPTTGTLFAQAGYKTAYFGKWHLGNSPEQYGFETVRSGQKDARTAQAAAEYLLQAGDRPFLAYVSFVNPHDVYAHPKRGERRYDTKGVRLPANIQDDLSKKPWPHRHFLAEDQARRVTGFDREDWKQYLAHYRHVTEKVDRQIGRVLTALKETRREDDTVVIFTSDHGDLAAGHGLAYKCPAMYEELIRVPLVIAYPGRFGGGLVVNELVSLIDLVPTMCELTGVAAPNKLRGRSLLPLLQGQRRPDRQVIFGEYYGKQKWMAPVRMIRTERWKYCLYKMHGEELYDLEDDPGELRNLAGQKQVADIQQRLRAELRQWMRETNDPFEQLAATDRKGKPLAKR